jgi:hypothetical protein
VFTKIFFHLLYVIAVGLMLSRASNDYILHSKEAEAFECVADVVSD